MTDTATDNGAPAPGRARGHRILLTLSLVMAVAALAAAAWTWMQVERRSGMEARQDAASASLREEIAAQQRALGALELANRQLQDQVRALDARQAEFGNSLEGLVNANAQSHLELALDEVEYLLVLAGHQLALSRDPGTALAALEAAAARLTGLAAPGLDDVRAQIAADMAALREVQPVDLAGLSSYLADLSVRADQLAFREDKPVAQKAPPPASGGETGWRGIWRSVLRELRSLVTITRSGAPAAAVLLPEQRWFLVQNLRLQLETARFAVLKQDTAALRSSISTALDWLDTWFDRSSGDVANAMESLGRMAELELRPELPDVSSSLETVRAYTHEHGAGGKSDTPP